MWLILSAAAFMASGLIYAVVVRPLGRAGAGAGFVAVGGRRGAAMSSFCPRRYGLTPPSLAATLTYAFACELYMFLFTLVGNSVSFGLLTQLARRPLTSTDIAGFS